ncbi:MAG: ATP phosphoribosyltransferase regulatory subunit [Acidaminobacteraceae bacterium]
MKNLTLNIEPTKFKSVSKILHSIRNTSLSYGYEEFFPSTLEYFDEISRKYNKDTKQLIKFVNSSGELMALKDDPTLSVTKYICQRDYTKVGYSKYFYTTSIFKWTSNTTSNSMESLQGGIEYYGNSSPESDCEIIQLGAQILKNIDVTEFKIDIADINYLHGLLDSLNITNDDYCEIVSIIDRKNIPELAKKCDDLAIPKEVRDVIVELPKLFGNPKEILKRGFDLSLNDEMKNAMKNLEKIVSILSDYNLYDYIEIDLAFSNEQKYYSSTVFKFYSMTNSKTILSGGRYDNLSKAFKANIPACGIAFNIKNLIEVIDMINDNNVNQSYAVLYKEEDRKSAFSLSSKLRKLGYEVKTDLAKNVSSSILDSSFFSLVDEILYLERNTIKVFSNKLNSSYKINIDLFMKKIKENSLQASIH